MGRMYSATFSSVPISTLVDFFEINAPSDAIVVVHRVIIGQYSDFGDAQSEMLLAYVHRGSTSGSGGAALSPTPMEVGDPAFGGTVEGVNTTQSTVSNVLHSEPFNVMAGLDICWTPETRPVISPSGRLVVSLYNQAPTDAITMGGTIYFEEIGG